MHRILTGIWILLLAPSASVFGGDKPPAPAAQFQAMRKEFNDAARGLYLATNDAERKKSADLVDGLSPRVLELAEKHPKDPIARDALIQVITQEVWLQNNTTHPGRGKDNLESKAMAQLLRDHLDSDKLGDASWRATYGFSKDCETFLRTVLKKSPHKEVQGNTCLRLAQFLNGRQHRLDLLEGRADMAKRYEGWFGKEFLKTLKQQDRAQTAKEIEDLYERAIEQFSDVKMPYGDIVGKRAKIELHGIRHLSVGKPAQDIVGDDQDGKRFKLSDYRGKVVLLYFWSDV